MAVGPRDGSLDRRRVEAPEVARFVDGGVELLRRQDGGQVQERARDRGEAQPAADDDVRGVQPRLVRPDAAPRAALGVAGHVDRTWRAAVQEAVLVSGDAHAEGRARTQGEVGGPEPPIGGQDAEAPDAPMLVDEHPACRQDGQRAGGQAAVARLARRDGSALTRRQRRKPPACLTFDLPGRVFVRHVSSLP